MRVAVGSRSFSRHPVLRDELLKAHPQTTFNDAGLSLSGSDLVDYLKGHDAAVIALEHITDSVLEQLPQLRVISKFGVGFDALDLEAMVRRGVRLGWTGGSNRRSVSELALCFALSMLRNIPQLNAEIRDGTWKMRPGRQLTGKLVGIVGCGNVGQDLGRILRSLGCRVMACDIRNRSVYFEETGVEPASLDKILREAEIVSLHLPLDDSTRNILSAERLAMMRSDAILINTARGNLVDEVALKNMLCENRLAGAAFDVFATEPPQDLELLRHPNFLSSPHLGGSTDEGILAMGRAAIHGLTHNRLPEPGVYPT